MPEISDSHYLNHVNVDCVIFSFEDNQLKTLIAKLNFKGDFYALPSGFILKGEDLTDAVQRVLFERTGIENVYLNQFQVFGKANRGRKDFIDALIKENFDDLSKKSNSIEYQWFTDRFISIGYYALVDINKVKLKSTQVYASLEWVAVDKAPEMILDCNVIFEEALKSLRQDVYSKANVFNLLPEKFTMNQVQELYEAILQRTFVRTNFQKKVLELDVLERLEKKYTGAKNKAPFLYRLKS